MLLNRIEYALMNNPLRAAIQRHYEAARLLRMGGGMQGGTALEVGCGRGVGTELILDVFGADHVDAFDLAPRMVAGARARLRSRQDQVRLWVGDASAVAAPDAVYDAVFDFGIIHHIPDWRAALREVARVLKPGGCFYAEEVLAAFIAHPVNRWLLEHPQTDRFDREGFVAALRGVGLILQSSAELWSSFAWFIASKPAVDQCVTRAVRRHMSGGALAF